MKTNNTSTSKRKEKGVKLAGDMTAYFYLRARGIDKETAESLSENQHWLFVKERDAQKNRG